MRELFYGRSFLWYCRAAKCWQVYPFNAVTSNQAAAANYPFCTIDPNVGSVEVLDPRLEVLSKISKTNRLVYATCDYVDIAGLVEGASKGEGLGNAFYPIFGLQMLLCTLFAALNHQMSYTLRAGLIHLKILK